MPTRLKICGLSRQQDALHAAKLGVDAIGLVFYPPSPRAVTVEQAREVIRGLPPFVTVVALFVDPEPDQVVKVLRTLPIDLIQFQGEESPEQCQQMAFAEGRKYNYIKAIRMREDVDVEQEAMRYADASALLLDAYSPGVPGGTGEAFEWSRVPATTSKPIILAGGLTADNVAAAIATVHPYAVDVSGGVETGKGIKDQVKMTAFARAVRQAG